jgi:Tol biopolymer transport system component
VNALSYPCSGAAGLTNGIDAPFARMPKLPPPLLPGQRAQVRVMRLSDLSDRLVFETERRIEAPNWTKDGAALIVNGEGRIFRLELAGTAGLEALVIGAIDDANNDHVLSPDGATLYLSAGGGIFAVPTIGGTPHRLSPPGDIDFYLHGISPDGGMLACTTKNRADPEHGWGIHLLPVTGGEATAILTGRLPLDGPEWTPDGAWIWFNGELAAERPGHAQLFRMRPDGSAMERMCHSATVDWFPHPDPAGTQIVYLSYPEGTLGHPVDRQVALKSMPIGGGAGLTLARFNGGQGTINVNSWSPDGTMLAYIAYPYDHDCQPNAAESRS